jgi:hypothetical protein
MGEEEGGNKRKRKSEPRGGRKLPMQVPSTFARLRACLLPSHTPSTTLCSPVECRRSVLSLLGRRVLGEQAVEEVGKDVRVLTAALGRVLERREASKRGCSR